MKKIIAMLLALVLALSMLTACGSGNGNQEEPSGNETAQPEGGDSQESEGTGDTDGENIKIGITTIMSTISYYINAVQGIEDNLREGDTVTVFDFTADVPTMVSNMEDIVTKEYDVMVYTAFSQDAIDAPLKAAQDAGVLCLNYDMADSAADTRDIITAVYPDDYQIGYEAGKYLAELNDGQGKYGIYLSPETATSDSEYNRDQGFLDALSEYPDMEVVVNLFPTNTTPEDAMSAMEAALQAHPDLDGFFSVTEWVTTGVVQACKASDVQIDLVTVDVNDTLLGYLEDGYVCACIDLNAYEMGKMITEAIYAYLDGEEVDPVITVPTVFVDQDNMADYMQ